jgi:hypothetical protein
MGNGNKERHTCCNCKVEILIVTLSKLELSLGPNKKNEKGDRDKIVKSPKWDIGPPSPPKLAVFKNLRLDKHDNAHTNTISKEVWKKRYKKLFHCRNKRQSLINRLVEPDGTEIWRWKKLQKSKKRNITDTDNLKVIFYIPKHF